jgi:hypothetical protein
MLVLNASPRCVWYRPMMCTINHSMGRPGATTSAARIDCASLGKAQRKRVEACHRYPGPISLACAMFSFPNYFGIDVELVWNGVENHLAPLKTAIENFLNP